MRYQTKLRRNVRASTGETKCARRMGGFRKTTWTIPVILRSVGIAISLWVNFKRERDSRWWLPYGCAPVPIASSIFAAVSNNWRFGPLRIYTLIARKTCRFTFFRARALTLYANIGCRACRGNNCECTHAVRARANTRPRERDEDLVDTFGTPLHRLISWRRLSWLRELARVSLGRIFARCRQRANIYKSATASSRLVRDRVSFPSFL